MYLASISTISYVDDSTDVIFVVVGYIKQEIVSPESPRLIKMKRQRQNTSATQAIWQDIKQCQTWHGRNNFETGKLQLTLQLAI